MVAYSFQPRFVAPVLSGRKPQTIRAIGKRRHAKAGDELQLYTGMRTRACRLILRARCLSVQPITIVTTHGWKIWIGDHAHIMDLDAFAQLDGFVDLADMQGFWAKHHPEVLRFEGVLIEWKPPASVVEMGANILEAA